MDTGDRSMVESVGMQGTRILPLLRASASPPEIFPGPSGKPANPRPTTHVPFPTSTRLCHKARGCAGRRTTPGPGRITFPTPKGVVPSCRLGTTPREHHGTYLIHRYAEHPNPVSSSRLRVSARDFFRVPRKGMHRAETQRRRERGGKDHMHRTELIAHSPREAEHPNPVSSSRLGVFA